jgi:predicted nucleotide-binding protein (sugar kinase/HSP70/actin superfamily)
MGLVNLNVTPKTIPITRFPATQPGIPRIPLIRRQYRKANIVAIDYDPGASEVNQLNRIKLMLEAAKRKIRESNCTAPER